MTATATRTLAVSAVIALIESEHILTLVDDSPHSEDCGQRGTVVSADFDGLTVRLDHNNKMVNFAWDEEFSLRNETGGDDAPWVTIIDDRCDDPEPTEPHGTEQMENNDFAHDDGFWDMEPTDFGD